MTPKLPSPILLSTKYLLPTIPGLASISTNNFEDLSTTTKAVSIVKETSWLNELPLVNGYCMAKYL